MSEAISVLRSIRAIHIYPRNTYLYTGIPVYLGLARAIYIRFTYGIFGREITQCTGIYGVYIRFWPTLHISMNPCDTYIYPRNNQMAVPSQLEGPNIMLRVGQIHTFIGVYGVHTVFKQGNNHTYGHIGCRYTVLANPRYMFMYLANPRAVSACIPKSHLQLQQPQRLQCQTCQVALMHFPDLRSPLGT